MTEEDKAGATSTQGKYLTFAISKERYGIAVLKVQEIIKVTHITSVPRCPSFVKGVINLRGKIIPVIDLRMRFGIPSIPYDDKTCIVVISLEAGEQRTAIGIIVDTVLEVVNFSSSEIEPAPNYGGALQTHFIMGMGKKDKDLNILIDIDRVITASEGTEIAQMSSN